MVYILWFIFLYLLLVFGTSRHNWTSLISAKLGNCPVQHVYLIKEIDSYLRKKIIKINVRYFIRLNFKSFQLTIYSDPLVDVLALWQHDSQPQVATSQSGGCMLHQVLGWRGTGIDVFSRLERLIWLVTTIARMKNIITVVHFSFHSRFKEINVK